MSTTIELTADVRKDVGKGASRRLRREQQKVPAIIYGGDQDAVPLSFDQKDIAKAMENESFFSQIVELNINGQSQKAILRDIHRHAYKPKVTHLDFQRITGKETLTVTAHLNFIGDEDCPAIKAGGIVTHHIKEVDISCSPANLPEHIDVDISHLEMDQVLHLSDLIMPAGVTLLADLDEAHNQPIASAHMAKIEVEEAPSTTDENEQQAGEEQASTDTEDGKSEEN